MLSVNNSPLARSLVVNWNSQELNQLALALARRGDLAGLVRPYVNQGRAWERALARLPLAGRWLAGSFGRRQLIDLALHGRVIEAGVAPDLLAALVARLGWLGAHHRHSVTNALFQQVRNAVATQAGRHATQASHVVVCEGFALEAFQALRIRRRPHGAELPGGAPPPSPPTHTRRPMRLNLSLDAGGDLPSVPQPLGRSRLQRPCAPGRLNSGELESSTRLQRSTSRC